jgi:site-specific recombinase XerD
MQELEFQGKVPPDSTSLRTLRSALVAHLSQSTLDARKNLIYKLRGLARYMKFHPEKWTNAVERLFSMRYQQAQLTVNRYKAWHQKNPGSHGCKGPPSAFITLSRSLREKGAISWEFRHEFAQAYDKKWSLIPKEFRAHADDFIREGMARNLSRGTLWQFNIDLADLGLFLARKRLHHATLSYRDAVSWLDQLRLRGLQVKSLNRSLRVVRRFYLWLIEHKVVESSPFATIRTLREPRHLPRILSEKQMKQLILGAEGARNRAILEVFYASGCRLGDLRALDVTGVSLESATARTVIKGGHESILYLNHSAISAIRRYFPARALVVAKKGMAQQPALFLAESGRRMSGPTIRLIVQLAARRALPGVRVHPHMIRHSFATHLLNRGADVFSIMKFLGHTSIQSTIRYLQVATARLSEVHRKFHPRK